MIVAEAGKRLWLVADGAYAKRPFLKMGCPARTFSPGTIRILEIGPLIWASTGVVSKLL